MLVSLALLGLEAAFGGTSDGPGPGRIEQYYLDAVPDRSLIGQRLMVRMDGVATKGLVRQARRGQIGGVTVFPALGQAAKNVGKQVDRLQRATERAGLPPLLVSTDQEGGEIKRFPEGPPATTPAELGANGKPATARKSGRSTGKFLAGLGINVDLAPVLDVPISDSSAVSSRAFSRRAETVAKVGVAFARGLQKGGALPVGKHFPGLGKATQNTDFEASQIDASRKTLDDDLLPFRAAIKAGVPMIMVGNAIYKVLDENAPAALSRAVVQGLLRNELGFDGVAVSDDLGAVAVRQATSAEKAPVDAARAGIDVLLFAQTADAKEPAKALRQAARKGELDRDGLQRSFKRIVELKDSLPSSG